MARPTKAEQEKKRIAGLLAEGKGPDGRLLPRPKRGRPSKQPLEATQKELHEQYEIFMQGGTTKLPKAIKDLINLRYNHYKNYTFPGSPIGYKGKKYSTAFFDHMQFSNNIIQDKIETWKMQNGIFSERMKLAKENKRMAISEPVLRLDKIPFGYISPIFEYEKLLKENDKIVYGNNLPSEISLLIANLKSFLKNAKTPSLLNRLKRTDDEICKMINDWLLTMRLQNVGFTIPELESEIVNPTMDDNAGNNDSTKHNRFKEPIKENGSPELDDLSPTEKRKQVEMFADAILETYGEFYLAAFAGYCSVKMNKLEILDRNGDIRLSMVIEKGENGELTVSQYFIKHNENASDAFTVTPEMKLELREPLIAVIMEKGVTPSPTTQLIITIGRHILMGVSSAVKMKTEMLEVLETFKQFRQEEKDGQSTNESKKVKTMETSKSKEFATMSEILQDAEKYDNLSKVDVSKALLAVLRDYIERYIASEPIVPIPATIVPIPATQENPATQGKTRVKKWLVANKEILRGIPVFGTRIRNGLSSGLKYGNMPKFIEDITLKHFKETKGLSKSSWEIFVTLIKK